MHTKPMAEHEGTFGDPLPAEGARCPKCRSAKVTCETWDSSCGGYTDYKFTCGDCKHTWWVEGPDS